MLEWIRTLTGTLGLDLTNAQSVALVIGAVLVPFVTQWLKAKLASTKWDPSALSLMVLVWFVCVGVSLASQAVADLFQDGLVTWGSVLAPSAAMFTISQLIYSLSGLSSVARLKGRPG